MKIITAILLASLLAACAHRRPLTYDELSGVGTEPPGGYQAYLP